MQSKSNQILINSCSEFNLERIKNAIEFIEASRINDVSDEHTIAYMKHFKDKKEGAKHYTQAKVITQIIQFEDNFKYLTGDKL